MSSCPQCFVGLCKRHKLQDHGKRSSKIGQKIDKKSTLDKIYAEFVGSRLQQAEALERWNQTEADTDSYKLKQKQARELAAKQPRKKNKENPLAAMGLLPVDDSSDEEREFKSSTKKSSNKKKKKSKSSKSKKKKKSKKSRKREESSSESDDSETERKRKRRKKRKRLKRERRESSDSTGSDGGESESEVEDKRETKRLKTVK